MAARRKAAGAARRKAAGVLSAEERAAIRELARERRAEARWAKDRAAGEQAVAEKIAAMPEPDRSMAERIGAIVTSAAPQLAPRTWYGMPAYANREGQVVCFFKPASQFGERYATFGFNPAASLDEGNMWPIAFALVRLTRSEERAIAELVRRAVRTNPGAARKRAGSQAPTSPGAKRP